MKLMQTVPAGNEPHTGAVEPDGSSGDGRQT